MRYTRRGLLTTMISWLLHFLQRLMASVKTWLARKFGGRGGTLTFDTGRSVNVGSQIAEGGFSVVFGATDVKDPTQQFALKRIHCPEPELLEACRREASVHRSVEHPFIMPLLGLIELDATCYMLFPFLPHSLRAEVNRRTFDVVEWTSEPPWSEVAMLQLFHKICIAVQALHTQAGLAHADIKLENVLLESHGRHDSKLRPVLMDFGSTSPLTVPIDTRRQVLELVEHASEHTTLPYRAPELFDGGVRAGDDPVDYTKVDVWSLGCTLFAMMYGASPLESEFVRSSGHLKVIECTQLSVYKEIPTPPKHAVTAAWYSSEIHQLLQSCLTQDRHKRPTLTTVMDTVDNLITQRGGKVDRRINSLDVDSGMARMNRVL